MADYVISTILKAHTGEYKREMNAAATATDKFGQAAKPAAKSADSMAVKVGKLAGAGYVAKKAFDATAGAAISWESAFAGVQKTVDGTSEQLAEIEEGLRAMSREIPVSAAELANIAASAGQLGIETPNILEFTRVIADLGETTNLTGEQAATSLARFANITQMSQNDFDRLASTIVDLGNNFQTTEAEIVEMGMRLAGAGHQVGMTEAEILALSTALSSVGIEAEAGGSAISKVMIEIASQVENGGDKLALFARTAGMSADEFSTAWRDDAAGALVTFVTGLGNMEAQGGSTLQVLEELGITEVRMRDALLRTSSASEGMNRALAAGTAAWEDNIAAAKEAAVRYDTVESNISELGNSLSQLGSTIGQELMPEINSLVKGLNTGLSHEMENLGGQTVTTMDAIAAAAKNPLRALELALDDGSASTKGVMDRLEQAIPAMRMFTSSVDDSAGSTENLARKEQLAAEAATAMAYSFDDATAGVDEHSQAQQAAATSITAMNEALAAQHETMLAQIDPVFALSRALGDVETAQDDFNTAVKEHGPTSKEARRAALDLTEAVSKAEAAAINGEMSFSTFEDQLHRWVDAGILTAQQAATSRDRVAELRGEAERFSGDYRARISVDTTDALNKIFNVRDELRRVPNTVQVSSGNPARTGGRQARANGGPVDPYHSYTVGERGPETFVPDVPGYILPNGGGGAGITVNVHVAGSIRSDREVADVVARELNRSAALTGRA